MGRGPPAKFGRDKATPAPPPRSETPTAGRRSVRSGLSYTCWLNLAEKSWAPEKTPRLDGAYLGTPEEEVSHSAGHPRRPSTASILFTFLDARWPTQHSADTSRAPRPSPIRSAHTSGSERGRATSTPLPHAYTKTTAMQ
ncbi:hypothetical protein MTO96_048352 [Rhipicephalus appendiculatus]